MVINIITDLTKKINLNYFVKEKIECGIVLLPWETKSIRFYGCSIVNSYAFFKNFEFWLAGMSINIPFFIEDYKNLLQNRKKKLLIHKSKILSYIGLLNLKGCTFVPSKIYWKNNFIKIEICLVKGKKKIDKRKDIINKEFNKLYDI